ncbi:MAG: multicopper oxidase family protein [Thermoplasmatota archaeon]
MDRTILLVGMLTALTSLAGCFGDSGSSGGNAATDYEPRTVEIELIINADSTIPLYTLNDGVTQAEVVAMGFELAGSEEDFSVPGPQIRVREGDTVIIHLTNGNPLPHTFHLHGNLDDWMDDGVPFVSQMPVHSGMEHTYVFEDIKAGTYWYHCHVDVAHHIDLGMYGAFIVEENEPTFEYDEDLEEHVFMLDEWDNCHVHAGAIGPFDPRQGQEQTANFNSLLECAQTVILDTIAQNSLGGQAVQTIPDSERQQLCDTLETLPEDVRDQLPDYQRYCGTGHYTPSPAQSTREWYYAQFPVYEPNYNTYLMNGKAFPDTKPIILEEGKTYRWRLINVGEELHSMHIHGHSMLVTHRDGFELSAPFRVDTLGIMPGERYDVLVTADNPGFWVFHDHVGLSVMNDSQAPGGMFTMIGYQGFLDQEWDARSNTALDLMDFTYQHVSAGHQH